MKITYKNKWDNVHKLIHNLLIKNEKHLNIHRKSISIITKQAYTSNRFRQLSTKLDKLTAYENNKQEFCL